MGSSESKIAAPSTVTTPKPDPSQRPRNDRVGRLIDPRSPSTDIDRTPIQVGGPLSRPLIEVENDCALSSGDPRSPSVGITRTPVKASMVGSLARRLGLLFLSEATDGAVSSTPHNKPSDLPNLKLEEGGELGSCEPLLTPRLFQVQTDVSTSPFVVLPEPQVELEVDFSLDEAEEAQESSLHNRLSMSLTTVHEGAVQIFADVHQDSLLSQDGTGEDDDAPDHTYALPPTASVAEVPVITEGPELPEEKIEVAPVEVTEEVVPVEAVVEEAVPVEAVVEEAVPVEADVEEAVPVEAVVEEAVPVEAVVEEAVPVEAVVEEVVPVEAVVEEVMEEAIVEAATEKEVVPVAMVPVEATVPVEVVSEKVVPIEVVAGTASPVPSTSLRSADPSPVAMVPVEVTVPVEAASEEVVPIEVVAGTASPVPSASLLSAGPSPDLIQQQTGTGIRCPTFDTKSPSQLVFKPQWLGKGFGATGNRARVRGRGGSSSSPLSRRAGDNENKGQTAKQKLRGKALAEGRSPLQILKTNSPQSQPGQKKLKVSTPDRQRLGQIDRRVLAVALDKENR